MLDKGDIQKVRSQMTKDKEFRYFSYLKLDSSVVTSCAKTDGK